MSVRSMRGTVLAAALAALAVAGCGRDEGSAAVAEGAASPGITDTSIKLGGTFPYSGPASAYSVLGETMKAYFRMANARGGIGGREVEYVVADDGYDPTKGLNATRRMVERDEVFAIFGTGGTPVSVATMDYLNKKSVPQAFVTTGASLFGADPEANPWSIGFVPDYQSEARAYAAHLERTMPGAKLGVLYQNDDLGKDYLAGLESTDAQIVAKQSYEVADASVASQVSKLESAGADVLVLFTTPKFAAQALATRKKLGWDAAVVLDSISSSPDAVLEPVGLDSVQGVMTAAYTKQPANPAFAGDPDVREYLEAMEQYAPKVNPSDPFAVIAWAEASALAIALEAMEEPTRESFMQALRSMDTEVPMLLPGIRAQTGPDDGYPVQALQVLSFDGTAYKPVGDVIDTAVDAG